MAIFPSLWISIKAYPWDESPEEDQERLRAAGIPCCVTDEHEGDIFWHEIQVAGEEVERACALLGVQARDLPLERPEPPPAIQCPQCQGWDVAPLPPYILLFLLVYVALLGFFASRGVWSIAVIIALVASCINFWLYPRLPRWRCRLCGHRWNGLKPSNQGIDE